MRRRLFNLAAATSLALCVATAAMWVRSYYRHYILIVVSHQRGEIDVTCARGALYVAAVPREAAFNFPRFMSLDPAHMSFPAFDVAFAGFGYVGIPLTTGTSRVVRIPFWPAVVGFALLAILLRRSARKTLAGHCPTCGYDLRATPEEGGALLERCPECGTAAAAGASAPTAPGCVRAQRAEASRHNATRRSSSKKSFFR